MGGGGRPPSLIERMLEQREDMIWLRIARGENPNATKPGDCGCSAINGAPIAVPASSDNN